LTRNILTDFSAQGEKSLGFNTGLDSAAFAKARLHRLLTLGSRIVGPGLSVQPWKPCGVIEQEDGMVIWGPHFAGERLDQILAGDRDLALDALRHWIGAQAVLTSVQVALAEPQAVGPSGGASGPQSLAPPMLTSPAPGAALIAPDGSILFPPEELMRLVLDAEIPGGWFLGAERWVHPDLTGKAAAAFTAAAMLYRVFCGELPFPCPDSEVLRDIREGNFIPTRLAAPGLERGIGMLIDESLSPKGSAPDLEALAAVLGAPGSGGATSFFHPLREEESAKLLLERQRFSRKKEKTVKARRFLRKNAPIITGVSVVILVLGIFTGSIISGRKNRPNTLGMPPREVVTTYYNAFGNLDHELMEACVINKAGKNDINMVTNYYVISRVRQAYEGQQPLIPAQEWIDAGSTPPMEASPFGISGLELEDLGSPTEGKWQFRAAYSLLVPDTVEGIPVKDELTLALQKKAWRIADIRRESPNPDKTSDGNSFNRLP
jgi:hypothetical protein